MLAGAAMMATAMGCCCGMNRCNPCCSSYGSSGISPSPCGPGGCSPTYGYPTGFAPSSVEYTAAFAPTTTITSAPVYGPAYATTALSPALPPY